MALDKAHKGYEYQDLLTAVFIIDEILKDSTATFIIDRKDDRDDKFDDISIITHEKTMKKQVKYSDDKVLNKADLSSARCDLAIDTLFHSWKERQNENTELWLCLAWEYIESDEEMVFLYDISCDSIYGKNDVRFLQIDINKIWPEEEKPINSWRRLRGNSEQINRSEFAQFLSNLVIEVNLPKSSHDIFSPGNLEKLAFDKLLKFGVGKYPNNHLKVGEVLAKLLLIVKSARANGDELVLDEIVYKIGVKKSFGNIEQQFNIDPVKNVVYVEKYINYYQYLKRNAKNILLGPPGAGKSWFVQNLIDYFETEGIGFVRHYCYTGMGDVFEKERITKNVFLANLMNDILTRFPHLKQEKDTKYGVDIEELQAIINCIDDETVFIIDGLDHIGRVYSLHNDIMRSVDTEIIKIISELEFPESVRVILVSQPVKDVLELRDQGFVVSEIPLWKIEEVQSLMELYGIENVRMEWKTSLSHILFTKSGGNPLYLTYILRELSKYVPEMFTIDLIEGFPAYDDDLDKYYCYLMERIPEENRVPQVLAGAPFYLNEQELGEITGLGNYVRTTIDKISSVLDYNGSNGGYIVYHESFRRYIVELLEKNGVNVTIVIYRDLIDWLVNKGLYTERKSYHNLLKLMYESKKYDDILQYCNKEFIVESMLHGNSIQSIKNNYELLMRAACKKKDYGKVIICTEISSMIHALEYSFDENAELYYQCIGKINGFDKLNDLLIYEGEMCLPLISGLKICYLCSSHNINPFWEPYIEKLIEISNDEQKANWSGEEWNDIYRYYICANLDLDNDMVDLLAKICDESARDERQIVCNEFFRRDAIDELIEIIGTIENNDIWKRDLDLFINGENQEVQSLEEIFDVLKNADENRTETSKALGLYSERIKWIIKNKISELKVFTVEISNRNWFYNWLIFIADVNEVINIHAEETDFEEKLIKTYELLVQDTDVFKGKPRTCDLYSYQEIIYNSICEPLNYIKSKEGWEKLLDIIHTMSSNTTTSLSGSTMGPLTTDRLFSLFLKVSNENNINFIIELINKRIEEEKGHRYYSYLADYSFKGAYALSSANKTEASIEALRQGVVSLLSYTFRKDRTFSRLLDSVGATLLNDRETGINNMLKLKPLSDAVVYHTDGRSTKRYQKEWFEILVEHDLEKGLAHLIDVLPQHRCHWIFEGCLKEAIIKCNNAIAPEVKVVLYKTLPNCKEELFIESYQNTIETLLSKGNEIQAVRGLRELVCRFDTEDKDKITNYTLLERIKTLANFYNIDWNYDEYLERAEAEKEDYSYLGQKKKLKDRISRRSFDELTYDEILTYISQNDIESSEYQSLFYYISNVSEFNEPSKRFIDALVRIFIEDSFERDSKEKFVLLVEELMLPNDVAAYLYMQIFLRYTNGWYERFTRKDLFSKSHSLSYVVAEETFFTYIANNMSTVEYSFAVGDQIINALANIEFHPEALQRYWDSMYDIINFRLSGQIPYNWKDVIEKYNEWDHHEMLFAILLSRLKFAESSRAKWIFSELNTLLAIEDMRKYFVKPLLWFLNDMDGYIDYVVSVILMLVSINYESEELDECGIKNLLSKTYPTRKESVDFFIRKMLSRRKSRVHIEYNYKQKSDRTSYFIDRMKCLDLRIHEFEIYGLDIGNVINKYFEDIISREMIDRYQDLIFNRSYNVLVPNLYFYNRLFKYFAEEIEVFLSSHAGSPYEDSLEEDLYEILIDDMQMIVSENNSINLRPHDLLLPDSIGEGKKSIGDEEWIRIASYERYYLKRKRFNGEFSESTHNIMGVSAVVFNDDLSSSPHLYVGEGFRLFSENTSIQFPSILLRGIDKIVISDLSLMDDPYYTYKERQYLGIRADVLSCLGITIEENPEGIVGVISNGEVVLRFTTWTKSITDIDSDSYNIPYLLGSQLEMRKDKFEQMSNIVGKTPYYYTNVYINE